MQASIATQNTRISERATIARRRLLEMHHASGVGHIGGNLSALDLLLVLYNDVLSDTDQFVLSKGHAAGALYIALWSIDLLSEADLKSFHREGTLLSGHPPPRGIPEILFGTGSLGHGLGLAAGLALAKRLSGEAGRVFCMTSDGEWNEGSNWESLIFACHQELSNLCVIVDLNGLQGFGTTTEVANLDGLVDRFRAFGATAEEVDGHDEVELFRVLSREPQQGPHFIVAKTVKGHGVSFMENRLEWHYLPMSPEQFAQAMAETGDL